MGKDVHLFISKPKESNRKESKLKESKPKSKPKESTKESTKETTKETTKPKSLPKSKKKSSKRTSLRRSVRTSKKSRLVIKLPNVVSLVTVKTPTHTARGIEKSNNIRIEHSDGFISIYKGPYGKTTWELKKLNPSDRPVIAKDDNKKICKIGSNSIEFYKKADYDSVVKDIYSYRKRRI